MTTAPSTFTFAVYPASMVDGDPFDAFLLEVPTLGTENQAARRAWWTAFQALQPIEPEEFNVCCWRNNAPGPLVGSGGIEPLGRFAPEEVQP